MNDNFSSVYGNNLPSTDQPPATSPDLTSATPNIKSPRAKMHTKLVVGFVALVLLAVASIGAMLFAAGQSQDQRSNAAGLRCPGFCAKTCSAPYSAAPRGMYACSNTSYVCCVKSLGASPTVVVNTPTPTLDNESEPNDDSTQAFGPISSNRVYRFSLGSGCTSSISCVDHTDVFYFLTTGGRVSVEIIPVGTSRQVALTFMDENGRSVMPDVVAQNGQPVRLETNVVPGKKYYIHFTFITGNLGESFVYTLNWKHLFTTPTPAGNSECNGRPNGVPCGTGGICLNNNCVYSSPTSTPTPVNSSDCFGRPPGTRCGSMGGTCINNTCVYPSPTRVPTQPPTPTPTYGGPCPLCQIRNGAGQCLPTYSDVRCSPPGACSNGMCVYPTVTSVPTRPPTPTPTPTPYR